MPDGPKGPPPKRMGAQSPKGGAGGATAPPAHNKAAAAMRQPLCQSNYIALWKVREMTSSCCSLVSFTKFTA